MNTPFILFDAATQRRQIAKLKELNLKWVRINVHWFHLEPAEGKFETAWLDTLLPMLKEAGVEPLVYLVGSARHASTAPANVSNIDQYPPRRNEDFAHRMVLLAQRYPSVRYWQVWNEPNIHPFWQPVEDPSAYGRLLQTTVQAFRAAVPDRKVVMGGMAYFSQMGKRGGLMLESLGNAGAFPLVDVVAYHPYTDVPEGDPTAGGLASVVERMRILNTRLRAAQVNQIWATEWGWSTYPGPKVWQTIIDEATQGEYLLRRLSLMMDADFDKVFWFALMDMDDRADPRDRYYGLITRDGRPKPAFKALKNFLAITGDRLEPVALPMPVAEPNQASAWRRADGATLMFFWGPRADTLRLPEGDGLVLHAPSAGDRKALPVRGA
jgi:beta-xylosidase